MNLIEQLGGYEWAKIIQGSREMGGLPDDLDLEDAILEYRRQHNIYEVGDLIFDLSNDDKKYTGQILKVGEMGLDFLVCYDNQGKRFCVITDDAIHATDAEIKAGRRL